MYALCFSFPQQKVHNDSIAKTRVEADILEMLEKDCQAFGEPQSQGSVTLITFLLVENPQALEWL